MTANEKPAVGIEPTTAPKQTDADDRVIAAGLDVLGALLGYYWPETSRTVLGRRNESATGGAR